MALVSHVRLLDGAVQVNLDVDNALLGTVSGVQWINTTGQNFQVTAKTSVATATRTLAPRSETGTITFAVPLAVVEIGIRRES